MSEPARPSSSSADWSAVAADSQDALELVRRRMGVYGKAMAVAGAFFLFASAQVGFALVGIPASVYFGLLTTKLHVLVFLIFVLEWQLATRARLSAGWLDFLDAATLLSALSAYAAMLTIPADNIANALIVTLITMAHVLARAVIVPSKTRRVLWLSSASCVPMLVAAYAIGSKVPMLTQAGKAWLPLAGTLYVATWAVVTVGLSVLVTRIIYGLSQKVRNAAQLGQYTIEEKIGEGGMGAVYRARHALLRRPTAVKLLARDRTADHHLQRFEREVQLTSQLSHPNTIAIYDYGHTPDGVFYYAMEYLDGLTLAELIAHDGPQPAARVVHVLKQACGALHEAHSSGLIHRDVKPANLMLCSRGAQRDQLKVLDFGLVKEFKSDQQKLSGANTLLGTPMYLAPEAITAPDSVDHRVDIYALGAVAYEMLSGATVFSGASLVEICLKHLHEQPLPFSSSRALAEVPAALEQLIFDCLAKDPALRPESAAAVLRRLNELGGVASWSADAAEDWWSKRGAYVSERAKARRDGAKTNLTVAVDLSERAS